jgi:hypothetical protein
MPDLARLRELDANADPAPWKAEWYTSTSGSTYVSTITGAGRAIGSDLAEWQDANALLIVAARNALPQLLAIAEAARDVVTMDGRFPLNMPRVTAPGLAPSASTRLAEALLTLEKTE